MSAKTPKGTTGTKVKTEDQMAWYEKVDLVAFMAVMALTTGLFMTYLGYEYGFVNVLVGGVALTVFTVGHYLGGVIEA